MQIKLTVLFVTIMLYPEVSYHLPCDNLNTIEPTGKNIIDYKDKKQLSVSFMM